MPFTVDKQYKYIEFCSVPMIRNVWACYNRKHRTVLGGVEWSSAWKQFVFQPERDCVFSADCLRDIQDFLTTRKKV